MKEDFTKAKVRRWMSREMQESGAHYGDNSTKLAENAAEAFGVLDLGGPLDDPDHWIWELALEATSDNRQVAEKLGHCSVDMTIVHYGPRGRR